MKKTTEKVVVDVEALFVEKAPRGNFGKKVFKLLPENFMAMTLEDLLKVPGLGRKGAMLAMEVACDLAGKK